MIFKRYMVAVIILLVLVTGLILSSVTYREGWKNLRPLPSGYPPAPVNDRTIVIANIPFMNHPQFGIRKPTWSEIKDSLPRFKDLGVDTIMLWGLFTHKPNVELADHIRVYTSDGWKDLAVRQWALCGVDYLTPDMERGNLSELLDMIKTAHSLGLKVIGQLQITLTVPGGYIYDKHPEWILKSIYGETAVFWPWRIAQYGYVVNKAHPELIKFITETVIPTWIEKWGLDGIYLDSPGMGYSDQYICNLCKKIGAAEGSECLTPVDGYYSPEPLVKAIREKMDELEKKLGRKLIFAAEHTLKTWNDTSEKLLLDLIKGKSPFPALFTDKRIDRSLGRYFDWTIDYNFRSILKAVYMGKPVSYSDKFVETIKEEFHLDRRFTETVKFANFWIDFHLFSELLKPEVAGCYLTLATTAPSRILWIGQWQVILRTEILKKKYGYKVDLIEKWYKRLIKIKRSYPALQSDNIEDALIEPRVTRLIAYNRWYGNQSVTVIVNAGNKHIMAIINTRFQGDPVLLIDLLSAEIISGKPKRLKVEMPPHSARILVEYKKMS